MPEQRVNILVYKPDGTLIAVYETYQGRVKPAVVLVG